MFAFRGFNTHESLSNNILRQDWFAYVNQEMILKKTKEFIIGYDICSASAARTTGAVNFSGIVSREC